jgi:adenylosuccinate lyase
MREALLLIRKKILNVIAQLSDFAVKYANLPTLGFTHFQPAQLTTVGKRASLWINELMMDFDDLEYILLSLMLLGSKGTTGTQASFMELFNNDEQKVKKLEEPIPEKLMQGF